RLATHLRLVEPRFPLLPDRGVAREKLESTAMLYPRDARFFEERCNHGLILLRSDFKRQCFWLNREIAFNSPKQSFVTEFILTHKIDCSRNVLKSRTPVDAVKRRAFFLIQV